MSFRELSLKSFYSAADDRLAGFYVPVLKEARRYDRVTGYYRSSSLVVAAAGISRFVARGGRMRIVAGAELDEADLRALREGEPLTDVLVRRLLADPLEGADIVAKRRLETLAYLAQCGRLQIRIGVPTDGAGVPLPAAVARPYFHAKFGVFTDEAGDQLAFVGSDNESAAGWRDNYETFTVARSWVPEVWADYGAPLVERFEALWEGRADAGWQVVPLPEAVAARLIAIAPPEPPPAVDPEEGLPRAARQAVEQDVRLQFLAVAPRIGGGTEVGFATAAVDPWPHQLWTARRIVESYPRSYLLADEVGLGKTIEVGLIVRELLVAGKAARVLLLVPASVLKQWQEELAEKFALRVPRLDRGGFYDVDEAPVPAPEGNPWRAFPVLLASSHLARRRSRRDEVLAAGPWDVVFVDEAHHAGRVGTKPDGTPNQLLRLLLDMRAARSFRALYLASATPMQMHAHEAWDLLSLLGLPGRWGESAGPFVRYYEELREPYGARDWEFLQRMSADHFSDPDVRPAEEIDRQVRRNFGLAGAWYVTNFAKQGLSPEAAAELGPDGRLWLDEWLRANTPMRERVFRTTRDLLRRYVEDGTLPPGTIVPRRTVIDRFIPLQPDEAALYTRIERYIARYYNAYMRAGAAQKALGFIMTVYRRRLTSSFLAIERSLQRRLDALLGKARAIDLLTADDLASLEESGALDLDALEGPALALAREVEELRDFLADLRDRPPQESKMERLRDDLLAAFRGVHDTAVVFTQYTDTLHYLRDQLLPTFRERLICYSGAGGERWEPSTERWVPVSKQRVRELFEKGEEVKILLGTDALSEGLNLQSSGRLINYDMPWNFMRVEQRIGRLDRIGGKPVVEVTNYFYEGTIEEQIYRGIGEDVDWFEDVVGPAQPVLNEIERAIEDLAMEEPGARRQADISARTAAIRRLIEQARAEAISVRDLQRDPNAPPPAREPAITLPDMEAILTASPQTRERLRPNAALPGTYWLDLPGRASVLVTFDPHVLETTDLDVRLLTYGTDELDTLLRAAGVVLPELVDGALHLPTGDAVHSYAELRAWVR
jgi:hypothetical protein